MAIVAPPVSRSTGAAVNDAAFATTGAARAAKATFVVRGETTAIVSSDATERAAILTA